MRTDAFTVTRRVLVVLLLAGGAARGGGITADVGLTPPVDRWMFRTQMRYTKLGDDPTPMDREMEVYAVPFVLAYGLRPNLTIIARQIAFHRRMRMSTGGNEETGRGDLALITKWRGLRVNRPDYIVGIAPTLGIEVPSGDDDFGSDTWDATVGTYFTGRRGPWGADLNLEYTLNGVDDRDGDNAPRPGDDFRANLALSYQVTLDERATMSLWPVLEVTYGDAQRGREDGAAVTDSGGHLLTVAPGVKFARQSFMLEALVQFPLDQEWEGAQLERDISALAGVRYLF